MKPWLFILLCPLLATFEPNLWADEEHDLIAVLKSTQTGAPQKCTACQRLRVIGTTEAVPALAALLDQEQTAHAARYALEGMPFPEAGEALRHALSRTRGLIKSGIIDSLGWRHDPDSAPLLVVCLEDQDVQIACAAAVALGRIGNEKAIKALQSLGGQARPELKLTAEEGLLRCAELLLARKEAKGAKAIYERLLAKHAADRIRVAAWRGLVLADSRQRNDLVTSALAGNDSLLRAAAQKNIRELNDPTLARAAATKWKSLPPDSQIAVLDASIRFGKAALPTIRLATASANESLRIAGWQALAELGEAADLPALAKAAAQSQGAERESARDALSRLHAPGTEAAIARLLEEAAPEQKVELLTAWGNRGSASSAALPLQYAKAESPLVRLAALEALRKIAAPETASPLLELAAGAASESEREAALKAVYSVCQASNKKDQTGRTVLDTLSRLPAEKRAVVLPVLAELGTSAALEATQAAARDPNPELVKQAIRVLSQWPNAQPAPTLRELARVGHDPSVQVLALRGFIQIAALEPDSSRRLGLLRNAVDLASRSEEKKQALGQIGQIPTAEALETALALMNDAALANEAGLAAVTIAEKVYKTNPELARDTAAKVLAQCRTPEILKRAWAMRGKAAAAGPFIQDWLVCGPYRKPGVTGAAGVFDIPFGPEIPGEKVQWKAMPRGDMANLMAIFPDEANCAAYLKAGITSAEQTEALLLLGSDDGVKAWLNGTVVHANNVDRGLVVDQDMAPIQLKKGSNQLLLKVTQGAGGWAACARIVGSDGQPLAGLQVEPQAGDTPVAAAPPPKAAVVPKPAALPPHDTFEKHKLSDQFYAEGAYYADFNRDGNLDIVAGPFWFEGPAFVERHEYRPAKAFDPKEYSDNFLTYADDFNGDGWPDILCVPFPGKEGYWYENPAGKAGAWKRHLAYPNIGNESPIWVDVDGDGRRELVFCKDGFLGYAGPNRSAPEEPWVFHSISTQNKRYQQFTHGAGAGDINGDKRMDIIEAVGWWEQPADCKPDQAWIFHPFQFAEAGAQMLVYDVNGDGLADVITAWHCHHYGLLWWRQGKTSDGQMDWKRHVILSPAPDVSKPDFRMSQMHAMELVDMNGDGLMDVLTGKRYWAHGPTGDKEPDAPALLVWFELQRSGPDNANFIPHLVDDDSGVGTQVTAADVNKDGRPDVVVANKKGIFVHLSLGRK